MLRVTFSPVHARLAARRFWPFLLLLAALAQKNKPNAMDACPHLRKPTTRAWQRLRDPLQWRCDSCLSTDGIWLCLSCGHIGCGRRAHLPALGGGHSKHHYHTTHGNTVVAACKTASDDGSNSNESNNNHWTKKSKILKLVRRSSRKKKHKNIDKEEVTIAASAEEVSNDKEEDEGEDAENSCGGHEVCIDIVSKAVHCYACDDYILSDAKWLAELRQEAIEIELRKDVMSISTTSSSSTTDDEVLDQKQSSSFDDHDFEMVDAPNAKKSRGKFAHGITGLDNLGNTCYMNSVLQMLSHCSGFRSFFRDFLKAAAPLQLAGDGGYKILRQTTVRLKETLHEDQPPDELVLTEATHALLRVLWSGRWRSIKPRYFVNAVWQHGGLFAARKQQDANEFLNFYLGRVDDELKAPNAKNSVMMDLFGVDQFQQVQCDECKTVTKRTEPLLGLVLSLPDDQRKSSDKPSLEEEDTTKEGDVIELIDCVKTLRSTGRFTGDDKFDCETCKEKTDASWNVTLQKRPQSLLISFRRTLWSIEKGVHKDSRRASFPLELDASEILDVGNEKIPDDDFESCHYNLTSVVSHSGSTPFVGHYIAYARNKDGWFLFNDSSVTSVKDSEVLEAEAFILLYERRGIPTA